MPDRLTRGERVFALAVVTVMGVFIVGLAGVMLVLQREHVAYESANDRCEGGAPRGVTGWTLRWNSDTETFTCIYARNGRPTGQTLRIRRGEL